MKKYLAIGTALSLVSANVHADSPSDKPRSTADLFLYAPQQVFEIHGAALLLQPTASNLHYAAEAVPLPLPSPSWKIHGIDTDYHWGFDLGVSTACRDTHTNLRLDWEHFRSTDSSSTQVSSENMIGPFFEIGPDATLYKKAEGRAVFQFDQVDLDFGILLQLGDRFKTNLFAGVSFAQIKQTLHSEFSSLNNETVRTITVPSKFIGAGPQLGMNFSYRIVKGFQLTGQGVASFFVGRQQNHTDYEAFSPALAGLGISPPNRQSTQVHKKTEFVPGLEGKLGLAYVLHPTRKSTEYMVKLEAGYQAQVYIDAIQSVDIGSEVITPPVTPDTIGVFARTFHGTQSNFALAGPYFALDIGF